VTTSPILLDRVPWEAVNAQVRREQRNREAYVPPISLFRWWARRPHALMAALIDAAQEDRPDLTVSDPFSGGGTVALEAARRGLSLYAQDLHPWPVVGLATALDRVDADLLSEQAGVVLGRVRTECAHLYVSSCPDHGDGSELSHIFWARTSQCPECARTTYLFPYTLVSVASRRSSESDGYFGCPACGLVSRHGSRPIGRRDCPGCDRRLESPDESLLAGRVATCAYSDCRSVFPLFEGKAPRWKAVLVRRMCTSESGRIAHFDALTGPDPTEVGHVIDVPPSLKAAIPEGIETSLLRRAGFGTWADLYPTRQLQTLVSCASAIRSLDGHEKIRSRLLLALCGAAEMAGYASRWDRYYPKAFEAIANHRFAALGLACETNLLGAEGRGTLTRRFSHSVVAARWAAENIELEGHVRTTSANRRRRRTGSGAILAWGSSERQLPSTASIDLVLTDPPYFDDVQYSELASLFLAWANAVDLISDSVTLDQSCEAVVNRARGIGLSAYQEKLTQIFTEARRTLKPAGRLVLTFHNTDIRAWWALSKALHHAGLVVRALAVAEAENSSDHSKRYTNGFTSDLVIECRPGRRANQPTVSTPNLWSAQGKELLAAGRALALGGSKELPCFIEEFRRARGDLPLSRIRTPVGGGR
jgi:putative DNA methylase